jgi:hypothetical protein
MITLETYLKLSSFAENDHSLFYNHSKTVVPALSRYLVNFKELVMLFEEVGDLLEVEELKNNIARIEKALVIYTK